MVVVRAEVKEQSRRWWEDRRFGWRVVLVHMMETQASTRRTPACTVAGFVIYGDPFNLLRTNIGCSFVFI